MKTYVKYPPRKQQSGAYSDPITLQPYERFQYICDVLRRRVSRFGFRRTPRTPAQLRTCFGNCAFWI